MWIEILESREYTPFGFRYRGEQVNTTDEVGNQLVNQGFARRMEVGEEPHDQHYGTVRQTARRYPGPKQRR